MESIKKPPRPGEAPMAPRMTRGENLISSEKTAEMGVMEQRLADEVREMTQLMKSVQSLHVPLDAVLIAEGAQRSLINQDAGLAGTSDNDRIYAFHMSIDGAEQKLREKIRHARNRVEHVLQNIALGFSTGAVLSMGVMLDGALTREATSQSDSLLSADSLVFPFLVEKTPEEIQHIIDMSSMSLIGCVAVAAALLMSHRSLARWKSAKVEGALEAKLAQAEQKWGNTGTI